MKELGWSTVNEIITERDIAAMRRLLSPSCEADFLRGQMVLRSDISERQTRAVADGQLQLPRVRTEFARRSFMYRAISAWNNKLRRENFKADVLCVI